MSYLFSPALDAASGDWLAGTDRPGGAPATQIVLWALRTQRGGFAPDESFGADYRVVQRLTAGSQAAWKAEVERALSRFVQRGVIRDVKVTVDPPAKGVLRFEVSFRDPRVEERSTLRLTT